MILTFLSHIYKRFRRSPSADKEIAIQVSLVLITLVIVGYSMAVGFYLEAIIVDGLKKTEPVVFLNGLLLYYFVVEFIIRYFIQSMAAWDAQAYLHLPIARSKIVNFLLGRSLLHALNIFVFLLFAPFALSAVAKVYGMAQAWVWLLSLWVVSLINHLLVVIAKQRLAHNVWGLLVIIATCMILAGSDYFGWYKLSDVSQTFFNSLLHGYWTAGLLFVMLVLLYIGAFRFFLSRLYPEELRIPERELAGSTNWSFLGRFGQIGTWIRVEMKMIFRNKRSREVFLMNLVFFLQALILYRIGRKPGPDASLPYGLYLAIGIVSSGFFAIYYGQFLFSWQARHFDLTLTQPSSIRLYVESKYWLLSTITGLWFVMSVPFLYIGWHILLVNTISTLYSLGINIFIVMNMSMWGARSIDLKHSGSMNYEGMGPAQWLIVVPFIAIPVLLYLPFSIAGYPIPGLVFVGLVGLTGLVFHRRLIDYTSARLAKRRYEMAANFRKD